MAVKDDFVFIVKGSKYSVYSYSDYDSHTTVKISAASMTSQKENVTIQQFSANGTLLQTSLLVLHYYSNLTTSSGLFKDLPDFSGYIDLMVKTAFNENYLYGNNIDLKIESESNHECRVLHEDQPNYVFDTSFAVGSSSLFFANRTAGVIRSPSNTSSQLYSLCGFWCDSDDALKCTVTDINSCRNFTYSPLVNKVVPVNQDGMNGVIAVVKKQTTVEIIYFPDTHGVDTDYVNVSNSDNIIVDIVYYVLGNDGFLAISSLPGKSPAQITIFRFENMELKSTEFFNITSGSSSLQTPYFCPTKLDVCPDNPSVLDVLSDCQGDTRILKYIMMLSDSSYHLFDMNTLNHPFIPPGPGTSKISFCAQGNELIVSAKVGEEIKVYGRTTEKEGVDSYHTFNFEDFGIDTVITVTCLNYMRGFAIYGKNTATSKYVLAVLVGNKQGDCNKKYAKVSLLPAVPQGSFSVSSTEVITYYIDPKSSTQISFRHLYINGPLIFTKFYNDNKFDNKMKLVIDRSHYNLENVVEEMDINLMPATNLTVVKKRKEHSVQKANYCLDDLFDFQGHVLAISIRKDGDASQEISVSQRLASYFSIAPEVNRNTEPTALRTSRQLQSQYRFNDINGVKFNRLFDLGDRLVGLASDAESSIIIFYQNYYSQEEKQVTISGVICQNIEVSIAKDFYFMVLKCNSQNVYSIVWVIVDKEMDPTKSRKSVVKRYITDKVEGVGIGREGENNFIIAANMISGMQFSVAQVTPIAGSFSIESEKNLTKVATGMLLFI
jgi:hypothetical protein